jgi:hypothetical protein
MTNILTPTDPIPAELAYLRAKVDVQQHELRAARREISSLRLRVRYLSPVDDSVGTHYPVAADLSTYDAVATHV